MRNTIVLISRQEGLRYSARDLTAKRAHSLGIPLVLGSATPSLESLYNVSRKRYTLLKLPHRAGGASMPSYHLIDLRGQTLQDGFSRTLIDVIRHHLTAKGQVLIYLNRRGFAPTLLCQSCGWQCHCSDCDAKLTLHRSPAQMICHHCMLKFQIPELCEHCGQPNLLPVGLGTQRAEDAVEAFISGSAHLSCLTATPLVPTGSWVNSWIKSMRALPALWWALKCWQKVTIFPPLHWLRC